MQITLLDLQDNPTSDEYLNIQKQIQWNNYEMNHNADIIAWTAELETAQTADRTGKDTPVSFTEDDYEAIVNQIEHVKGVSPLFSMYGTAKAPKTTMELRVTGGTPAIKYDKSEPIVRGRYFNESDFASGKAAMLSPIEALRYE